MADDALKKLVKEIVEKEVNVLRNEITKELPSMLNSIFGDSKAGTVLTVGVNMALDSFLSGKKINPRDIANAMAGVLVPDIHGMFNGSSAQAGESLLGMIMGAQRNM